MTIMYTPGNCYWSSGLKCCGRLTVPTEQTGFYSQGKLVGYWQRDESKRDLQPLPDDAELRCHDHQPESPK